jgi:hypothetical protein
MAGTPTRLSISDATEEILKRQRAASGGGVPPAQSRSGPAQSEAQAGMHYGALYAPPPDDVAELRRQQAAFARTTQDLDRRNSWMAIPALAPLACRPSTGSRRSGYALPPAPFYPRSRIELEQTPFRRNRLNGDDLL